MSPDTRTPEPDQGKSDPNAPTPMPAPPVPPTPDDARGRPDPIRKPATGGSAGGGNIGHQAAAEQGKVMPPDSPVDVPRMPATPDEHTPDEAAKYGKPRVETGHDSNWADNAKPKPDARNARSSLL